MKDCPSQPGYDPIKEAIKKERKVWRPIIQAAYDYINSEGDSWDNRQIIELGYARMFK